MWFRWRQAKEYDPTEVQIHPKKEEEVLNDKADSLSREDNFKPAIESNDSASKESVNVWPECIMRSIGGRAEEFDPTEVRIQ